MPSPSEAEFFSSIPRVQELLKQPGNVRFVPTCRLEDAEHVESKTQDQFFRRSLKDENLVPFATAFYQEPFTRIPTITSVEPDSEARTTSLLISSSTLVLYLQPGTNGFNGTAHGGLIGTLIDEAMGSLIYINHKVYSELPELTRRTLSTQVLDMHGLAMFTASMNVQFRAPLPTPSVVLAEATFKKILGRKLFIDVVVKSMDGVIHATCEGMWMSVRGKEKL